MSRESVVILLRHMLDAAREAHEFVRDKSREALDGDRQLQLSLIRCIEIVGEAASRLDADFRNEHPRIPWGDIIAMRNRLAHAYFDVDLDIVWSTSKEELPELILQIESMLDD